MKRFICIFLLLFSVFRVTAQILDPVAWETSVEKVGDNQYILVTKAIIDAGWHLYSQNVPEDGPIPTTFRYDTTSPGLTLIGKTEEEKGHVVEDPVFEMTIKYFDGQVAFKQKVELAQDVSQVQATVEYMVCDDTRCLAPTEIDLIFEISHGNATTVGSTAEQEPKLTVNLDENNDASTSEIPVSNRGLWSIFIVAFLSGFLALLTPCVFPMIPLTVSYFTKQSKDKTVGIRNAMFYAFCIVIIYVLLGSIITAVFGADSLNALATNVWFNLFFFFLLFFFAISFLGAFEITLPSSWSNQVDNLSTKGGFIGIFFMALALAIVSFSCTGPIVGTLLVEAASKGGLAPIIGMLGFSLAIALPFALFAAFPSWLQSLPKSGGWMNTIKVSLGFIELALAFKFLSQADLVTQMHLLEREVFIAIWIAISAVFALYLFGKVQLPHDSKQEYISVGRLLSGLLVLTFTVYLIPGLWGAPLKLISAFPPPLEYSESPYGVGFSKLSGPSDNHETGALPEGSHYLPPHDILAFNDYGKGLAYARKVNKPILLDFTGWACVNCRKMEQNVWPDHKVLEVLKNRVVLVSLYVDDKRPLPTSEQLNSKLRPGKKLKYIGQKWSEWQHLRFGANAQPYYVLMGHNDNLLQSPTAYTPNASDFYTWLESGIAAFVP